MFVWCLSLHLRHFHHYLFKYFITSLSLFFCNSYDAYILILMVFHRFLSLFIFLHSFFFLLLRVNNFNCLIFKFADPFFCLFKSSVKLLLWDFISELLYFQLEIFYLIPIYSLSLLKFLFLRHDFPYFL